MRRPRSILRDASPRTLLRRRRFPALERLAGPSGKVVLTFDDGPDVETPALLEVLDAHGIRATFFVVGEQVETHAAVASEAAARGHQLALHGSAHFRHDRSPARAGPEDMRRGLEQVSGALDLRPQWYRPPFGRFSTASYAACRELELTPVHWSASGRDWTDIAAAKIAANVGRDLGDGAIVLLHDSARYGERRSARATSEAIPLIAEAVRSRGLEFGTLT
jgi:peptidoglycan/xylan/chitin deacetylase (PgdA/CDA1 family)